MLTNNISRINFKNTLENGYFQKGVAPPYKAFILYHFYKFWMNLDEKKKR